MARTKQLVARRQQSRVVSRVKSRAPARRYRRRGYTSKSMGTGTVIGRQIGFPKQMLFKHKYVENVLVTATAGALANHAWRANSVFDPNYTGVGHQPLYYDQMAALYNHYTVIGSKIKVSFADADTTLDLVPCYAGIFVDDDASIAGLTYISIQEQSLGKSFLTQLDSRTRNYTCTYNWSAKKMFGGSILANNDLSAAAGANPVEQSHYVVWFAPADGSSTIAKYLRIEIEYICVWKELKDIAIS